MIPISDILLICHDCAKRLAIDPAAVGKDFRCPDCEAVVHVPRPDLFFQCQACKAGLYAASSLAESALDCPACRQPLTVPSESFVFCWNCTAKLAMDGETFRSLAGQSTRCPQCGRAVDIPPIPGQ